MAWTYYITDRKSCSIPLIENIRLAIAATVDFIQIREKDLASRALYELAVEAAALAHGRPTRLLINDRLDIALAAGLGGVHLGQSSVAPREVRRLAPDPDFLVGVSTHSLKEIREVEGQGSSFITFGPVFPTPSKAAYGDPVGLESLERAVQSAGVPVFALGGIDQSNYESCLKAGAAGIAAIRLFQGTACSPQDLVEKVRQFPAG